MIELNQDSNELTLELVSENVSFGGGNVEDVYQNGTSVLGADHIARVTTPTKTSDLTNDSGFITSSSLPTKTSDLTNDGDGTNPFLTTHQSLSGYATETWVENKGYLTQQDISGKENTSNKVTSLSSSSTDTQYPSAKAVYDELDGMVKYTSQSLTDTQKQQLWSNASIIKTTMDSVAVLNAQYFLGEQTSVSITMPSSANVGNEILVTFSSGATPCALTCNLQGFSFVPKANKTSWIKFTYCASDCWLVETKEG